MSRRLAAIPAVLVLLGLYLANLTGMGIYGPDEPRYAAIGQAMAATGDVVTPRLWGQPWFEKPPLLYWMTAAGFLTGLGPDLAPRLPVAILSLLFLAFFWWRLSLEWDRRAATCATVMLATSVGWLAYSHVAVTDLPLAVFFSAAVLFSLPWLARKDRLARKDWIGRRNPGSLTAAAACLALATLSKGLVPLVLFVPVLAVAAFTEWRRLLDWLKPGPILAFCLIALPWYTLVTLRNGSEFIRVFFIEQHFARFRSPALQHVQPVWFYVPILLVLLFPWFPLLAFPSIAFPAGWRHDLRVRTLASVIAFGFLFFSLSVNKLPGYLLPLLPPAFALLGLGVSRTKRASIVIGPVILLGLLPLISEMIPALLQPHGLQLIRIPWIRAIFWLTGAAALGAIVARYAPKRALAVTASIAGIALLWLQFAIFPEFNTAATSRPLWLARHPQCAPPLSRDRLYGLEYYAGRQLLTCNILDQSGTRVVR